MRLSHQYSQCFDFFQIPRGHIWIEGDLYNKSVSLDSRKYARMRLTNQYSQCFDFFQIPRGHIWIEGDNKSVSLDSREYGPVPYGLIKSRLMFRVSDIHTYG